MTCLQDGYAVKDDGDTNKDTVGDDAIAFLGYKMKIVTLNL